MSASFAFRNFARAANRSSSGAGRFARAARGPSFFASSYGSARAATSATPPPPPPTASMATRALSTTPLAAAGAKLGAVVEAGDADFDTILDEAAESNKVVIVDFYAPVLGPVLEKAVADNGKTFLVKVNTDEAQEIAAKYQIMSLPTVAVFRNKQMAESFVGSRDRNAVKKFVDDATA
ncbi:hypothetical protein HK097_004913 [Rhizophlyctis rosea]|uniref:Thioredoxin domain-containing protein n=1 Tax=Rhizophlyctis rosea TaxID=64517 RepID=A0AAD5S247_9FUNG|nr:hypothetical protein HK097_004913 [Rhizophlyctis rosea]